MADLREPTTIGERYEELRAAAVDAIEKAEELRHGHWNMSDATDLIDQQSEAVLTLLHALTEANERASLLQTERDEARAEWFRAVDHLRGFAENDPEGWTSETAAIFYVAERAALLSPAGGEAS